MSKRFLRQHRTSIVVFCLVFCVCVVIYGYSNVSGILSYYFFSGSEVLPLSIQCNDGRLGNQMCTYASLYGLSMVNHRRSFISLSCNLKHLKPYFPNLSTKESIPSYLYVKWNLWPVKSYFKEEDASIPANVNFIEGYKYPCSYTFFDHVQDEIRQEFRFSEDLMRHAHNVLRQANVHHLSNVSFVGVHVRRGDYQERWLSIYGGVSVNFEYFRRAVKYFRQKYNPVIFILISDDREWCIEKLSVRFALYVPKEAPSPAHDLSVLASCNHSIMTYGTFGFWGAYLAGGEVLYFDKFLKPNTTFTTNNFVFDKMYPPLWKGIATHELSVFENVTSFYI